jgi:hypothetical protein
VKDYLDRMLTEEDVTKFEVPAQNLPGKIEQHHGKKLRIIGILAKM